MLGWAVKPDVVNRPEGPEEVKGLGPEEGKAEGLEALSLGLTVGTTVRLGE